MADAEAVRQMKDGMRQIADYGLRVAEPRVGKVTIRWDYGGRLEDAPGKFTMTMTKGDHSQDLILPREPVEDYPGGVGTGKTESCVKEVVRLLEVAINGKG